jgi:predicted neuraminidase
MFEAKEIFEPFGCGPEPGKGSNHGSNLCEGPSGELIAVWYGGTGEKHEDVQIWMSKKFPGAEWQAPWVCEKEGKTSTIPEAMEEDFGGKNASSEGNPVLFFEPEQNRLHLWWITIYGFGASRGWSAGFIKYKHSDDLGETWVLQEDGQPRLLHDFWGMMIKNVPIRMSNGDMLLPSMAEWTSYNPIYWKCDAEEFRKGCLDSAWRKITTGGTDCFQPTIVELDPPGRILSLMRSSKKGKFAGVMAQMESDDYGETWTDPHENDYGFPNCDANNAMVKLANGHVVLVFNDSPKDRNPLVAMLSIDGAKTFSFKRAIEFDPDDKARFHYPCAIQSSDGLIQVTYSYSPHDNIKWASFDEDWIMEGDA